MTSDYEWVKVKGSAPELFIKQANISADVSPILQGVAMSAAKLRAELKHENRSDSEIDSVVQRAREMERQIPVCRCSNERHGHANPCGKTGVNTTDGLCAECAAEAAKEFHSTQPPR